MKNILYLIIFTVVFIGLAHMFLIAVDKEIQIRENFDAPYLIEK